MLGDFLGYDTRMVDFRPWTPTPVENSCVGHCMYVLSLIKNDTSSMCARFVQTVSELWSEKISELLYGIGTLIKFKVGTLHFHTHSVFLPLKKYFWKAFLECSTNPSRSGLSHVYPENRIFTKVFLFSGTSRSHKKPRPALVVSSRSCAIARRSSFHCTDGVSK
ncbi:hypothetical protein TNCV_1437101 [Trichonephila clavipes]|nr:hypothetical protein TNCV_1437101 [Trichonephila clavipes]